MIDHFLLAVDPALGAVANSRETEPFSLPIYRGESKLRHEL